jgi:hypothetical protein
LKDDDNVYYHHEKVEPPQMRYWVNTTVHVSGDLVGDTTHQRRTRCQFKDPPHELAYTERMIPIHYYMVLTSYPQTHAEVVGNPFQEATMLE